MSLEEIHFALQDGPTPKHSNGRLAPPKMLLAVPDQKERQKKIDDAGCNTLTLEEITTIFGYPKHTFSLAIRWWPYSRMELEKTLLMDDNNLFHLAHLLATEKFLQNPGECIKNTVVLCTILLAAIRCWVRTPNAGYLNIGIIGNKCCYSRQVHYHADFMQVIKKWACQKKERADLCKKISLEELD